MMPEWHVFAPSHIHHCFRGREGGGEGGEELIVPYYNVQDWRFQNKTMAIKEIPPLSFAEVVQASSYYTHNDCLKMLARLP